MDQPNNEAQTEKGELSASIQAIKQMPGWLYLVQIINNWKDQALTEVLATKESDKQKGEFEAYSRVLKLPDIIIQDLKSETPKGHNLDAYAKPDSPESK